MKPYIGILIDSFWEAVGNKVLWALLIGWSLILLALAPFGYVSERSFQLSSTDIDNRTRLVEKLAKAAKGQGPKAAQAVASQLEQEFLAEIKKAAEDENSRSMRSSQVAEGLNQALKAPELYSEDAFPTAKKRARLEPLIQDSPESLNESDLEELNRELIQLAFPLELNRPRGEQLWIGYGGFKIGDPLAISRRQISQFLEPIFLGIVIKLGLAVLAVFVAIIVTSPIIPDTFRSGSLHLLLSKPISRVWLYLSKFFGGCTFVFLNITFVLIGLYLIAGLRFGIWNNGLLACIPLLLFVFIIFYSVSGFAGLIWGNAIVCVVACMIFWFSCFALGFMHDAMMPQVEIMPQISRIKSIDGKLTSVNERGDFNVWNEEFSVWQPGIKQENGGQKRTFGPIYDAERKQVIVKSFFRVPFGNLVARSRKISLINLNPKSSESEQEQAEPKGPSPEAADENTDENTVDEAVEQDENAAEAKDDQDADWSPREPAKSVEEARVDPLWLSDPGPDLPQQVFDMVEIGDTIVAVCRGGIYRLDLAKLEMVAASEKALFGIKIPWASQSAFEVISPSDYFLSDNSYAAATAEGDGLVVYSSGSVDFLKLEDGKLVQVSNAKLEGDGTEAAIAQMNASYCVVARDELPLEILDAQMAAVKTVDLPDDAKVKQMSWVPDTNELAIVTHTGNVLKLNCETGVLASFDIAFNGSCSSISWIDASQAYVGVKPNRVYLIDTKDNSVVDSRIPAATILDRIYGWGVKPLYSIAPKPAALDNAMSYLLSGSETQTMNIVTNDLEAAQLELDIWTPIVSNLAFVIVVLAASCIYVTRKEY